MDLTKGEVLQLNTPLKNTIAYVVSQIGHESYHYVIVHGDPVEERISRTYENLVDCVLGAYLEIKNNKWPSS
jgi:hypothetical protein